MQDPNTHPLAESDDLAPYTLGNPLEVAAVLRNLMNRGDFVTIYFDHGKSMLTTRILDVDPKARRFRFDWAGQDATNRALQASPRNVFVALPDGVKVQFVCAAPDIVQHEGAPAFEAALPAQLVKLQRREFFRLQTPIVTPYRCHTHLPDGTAVGFNLHDISLGGVGLWAGAINAGLLTRGEILRDATLELGSGISFQTDLSVRGVRTVLLPQGEQQLLGCQFVALPRGAEAALQRQIAQLERERRALTG
ncbi:flagellar brake protein [Jeongeupia naejangsanensis]|uniref:Flagellar brake protein YcgR n=1 Tax=Jeongeupia naejangsanensis TaxID=613195 RepID=A0ABS2BH46_9NEIS|nr:flagellar brake protein [Jeongeupia naejangsanensis]MBM3114945.1 flagellar brake protein [Jeongeupia naejangsanensis]